MSKHRPVYATACTVEIHCPHCGMTIPDPDSGSEYWTVDQLQQLKGERRDCDACDEPIMLSCPSKVTLGLKVHPNLTDEEVA